jgi:excinuclease ABC subunit B
MAEDLTDYYTNVGVKVRYLHSDIDALERVEILRDLRMAEFDVLVGVNLLREGLDLPEVSLIAILDADKEGFLRSEKSLMQTAGRTARNSEGLVIFYGDKITRSMQAVIDETERRRGVQMAYNEKHGIIPTTILKSHEDIMLSTSIADVSAKQEARKQEAETKAIERRRQLTPKAVLKHLSPAQLADLIEQMKLEMKLAAKEMEFERAADIRDEVQSLEKVLEQTKP